MDILYGNARDENTDNMCLAVRSVEGPEGEYFLDDPYFDFVVEKPADYYSESFVGEKLAVVM